MWPWMLFAGGDSTARVSGCMKVASTCAPSTRRRHAQRESSQAIGADFSRSRFRDTRWYGSRFVDCTFAGEIKGSEFRSTDDSARVPRRPDMLDGVDLSRTSLVECEFYGLNFDRTVFPRDINHLAVEDFPCFLEHTIALLADHKTKAGEFTFSSMTRELGRLGPAQRRGVINLSDVVDP